MPGCEGAKRGLGIANNVATPHYKRTVTKTLDDNALVLQALGEARLCQHVRVTAGLANTIVDAETWCESRRVSEHSVSARRHRSQRTLERGSIHGIQDTRTGGLCAAVNAAHLQRLACDGALARHVAWEEVAAGADKKKEERKKKTKKGHQRTATS